jgi:outer membrane receptor for ferrienterochelin and colicins
MRQRVHLLLLLAVEATFSSAARAEDTEGLLDVLNQSVVTTASHTAETASTAPATATSISADDLRRYGIHTVEEAINFLSLGVSTGGITSTGNEADLGARGVMLNGDGASHFLYLLDGHALNEPFSGGARIDRLAGIPLDIVDHIEVIVGPGSVLYGSNAMLGVINIITKDAEQLRGGHLAVETELPVWRRATASSGIPFRLFEQPAGATFFVQYWDEYGPDLTVGPQRLPLDEFSLVPPRTRRGGPEDGIWGGTVDESTFARIPSAGLKLRVGNLQLSMRGRVAKFGVPLKGADFDDPNSFGRERNVSADLRYSGYVSQELELLARLYADGYDYRELSNVSRSASCPFTGVVTCTYEGRIVSRWAGLELQANYSWLKDGSLTTLIGVDGRRRYAGSRLDTRDYDTGALVLRSAGIVDATDATLGAYLQQVWFPVDRLGLNGGARLDYDRRFSPVVSPRAAASFTAWRGGTLKSIYAEAFRAPTFQESEFQSLVRARADDLKPERVRSIEGSFEQRFGVHRVLFGGFRSWWSNLIQNRTLSYAEAVRAAERGQLTVAVPNVAYVQFQNAASIDSYGFNAAMDGSFGSQRLRYGLNVTEAFSRSNDIGNDSRTLPVAPQFYGNARLSYDFGEQLPTLALAGFLLGARPADGIDAGFRPAPYAPTQIDLRLTASGAMPALTGLRYRFSVDRVFGDSNPYVIGPVPIGSEESPSAELQPVPPWRLAIGLEYSFLDE